MLLSAVTSCTSSLRSHVITFALYTSTVNHKLLNLAHLYKCNRGAYQSSLFHCQSNTCHYCTEQVGHVSHLSFCAYNRMQTGKPFADTVNTVQLGTALVFNHILDVHFHLTTNLIQPRELFNPPTRLPPGSTNTH